MRVAKRSAEHDFTSLGRSAEHGFTLVELMVSLLIFSLLAAAGVGLLAFSVRAQAVGAAKLADIARLNQLGSALSADLAQVRARPTRNEAGDPVPLFFGAADSGTTPMLRLVRAGWTNVDAAPRPGEQKVEYRLEGGALTRVAYPMLDGAAPGPAAAILNDVSSIKLRYRYAGAWSDQWNGAPDRPLPDAVEMIVTRTGGTVFRELFLVGTGYRTPAERGGPNAG
jgi:general secretion pathway protein J